MQKLADISTFLDVTNTAEHHNQNSMFDRGVKRNVPVQNVDISLVTAAKIMGRPTLTNLVYALSHYNRLEPVDNFLRSYHIDSPEQLEQVIMDGLGVSMPRPIGNSRQPSKRVRVKNEETQPKTMDRRGFWRAVGQGAAKAGLGAAIFGGSVGAMSAVQNIYVKGHNIEMICPHCKKPIHYDLNKSDMGFWKKLFLTLNPPGANGMFTDPNGNWPAIGMGALLGTETAKVYGAGKIFDPTVYAGFRKLAERREMKKGNTTPDLIALGKALSEKLKKGVLTYNDVEKLLDTNDPEQLQRFQASAARRAQELGLNRTNDGFLKKLKRQLSRTNKEQLS